MIIKDKIIIKIAIKLLKTKLHVHVMYPPVDFRKYYYPVDRPSDCSSNLTTLREQYVFSPQFYEVLLWCRPSL